MLLAGILSGANPGASLLAQTVVEIGVDGGCQIEFRTGANTLEEDVWVLFSTSYAFMDPYPAAARYELNDLNDSRIAPGERLIAATSRRISCGREWKFVIDVRMGSPLSFLATKEVRIEVRVDQRGSDQNVVVAELGSPACWAANEGERLDDEDLAECDLEEEETAREVTGPIRVTNFRSGPICDAGSAERGRAPSDRICEGRDVPIRGKDICIFNKRETRCTWWGFEFDYENANPNVSLTCIWTRDRAVDDGNYEEIRKSAIATDTVALELEGTSGHAFFPGFDTFPDASFSHPWLTVGLEYACSYPGQGDLFVAHYRLIFSSAFK